MSCEEMDEKDKETPHLESEWSFSDSTADVVQELSEWERETKLERNQHCRNKSSSAS